MPGAGGRHAGVRSQVTILWNANNTFAFERIDWRRLTATAILTTVSRYMKQRMQGLGATPLVNRNCVPVEMLMPSQRGPWRRSSPGCRGERW